MLRVVQKSCTDLFLHRKALWAAAIEIHAIDVILEKVLIREADDGLCSVAGKLENEGTIGRVKFILVRLQLELLVTRHRVVVVLRNIHLGEGHLRTIATRQQSIAEIRAFSRKSQPAAGGEELELAISVELGLSA